MIDAMTPDREHKKAWWRRYKRAACKRRRFVPMAKDAFWRHSRPFDRHGRVTRCLPLGIHPRGDSDRNGGKHR